VLTDQRLAARLAAGGNQFVRERHDRRKVVVQLCRAYVRLLKGTKRWQEIEMRPRVDPERLETSFAKALYIERNGNLEGAVHASA
jgi:hypothetical protein